MTPLFAFFVFLNAWAVSLFLAFPFSIEMGDRQLDLEYQASPKRIQWKKMLIIATCIAAAFTLTLAIVIKSGIVPVRNME
jgi:predicted secreted protein